MRPGLGPGGLLSRDAVEANKFLWTTEWLVGLLRMADQAEVALSASQKNKLLDILAWRQSLEN